MATQNGSNIGLVNNYAPGDNGWSANMNKMLRLIDMLAQGRVINSTTSAPPGSPAEGDAYIIAGSPTGVWSGFANSIARWSAGLSSWDIIAPKSGWMMYDVAAGSTKQYSGSSWAVFSGGGGGSSTTITINAQTANYTLALSDAGYCIEMSVAGANSVTIPPNSSVAFPVGTNLMVRQMGAGQTSIVAGAGVTILNSSSLNARTQYSQLTLHKSATDTWVLGGDMA